MRCIPTRLCDCSPPRYHPDSVALVAPGRVVGGFSLIKCGVMDLNHRHPDFPGALTRLIAGLPIGFVRSPPMYLSSQAGPSHALRRGPVFRRYRHINSGDIGSSPITRHVAEFRPPE